MTEGERQAQVVCTLGNVYTVQDGDTFTKIAERFGLTAGELSELNPYVDVATLTPGQLLCIPKEEKKPSLNDQCPEGYTAGVVRAGETYADLLKKYNISYQAFLLSNPRLIPSLLREGQHYCVPPEGTRRICTGGAKSYVVKEGETLDSIAADLKTTPGRLLRLNPNLAPSDFEEGQQICVLER